MIFEDLPRYSIQYRAADISQTPHTEILHHNLVAVRYCLLLYKQCISIFIYCLLVNIKDCDSIKVRDPGSFSD
jgi:hypothetical protein